MRLLTRICYFLVFILALSPQLGVAESRAFQQIIDSGELRIGTALYLPWAVKTKSNTLVGFEIDMAKRLAKDMGLKDQIVVLSFNELIPALQKGDVDVIAAGLGVSPYRALKVNFSHPYAASGINMAANIEVTSAIKQYSDMNRQQIKIAVLAGSVSVDLAKRLFPAAQRKVFDNNKALVAALLSGGVHAYIGSIPEPQYLALKHPDMIDVPLVTPLLTVNEAFAVRKGDADFINFLNAWIVSREADGWIASSRQYWFDSLKWQQQLEQ
jgi:polar amino acid transport system substrate-binding protein